MNTVASNDQLLYDAATRQFSGVTEQRRSDWAKAFPGVDIERELLRAAIWWRDNPKKRKKDIARFLSNWMSKAERGFPNQTPRTGRLPVEAPVQPAPVVRGTDGLTPRERVLQGAHA